MMDLNLVVVAGRLAATPEVRIFESGTTMTRLLITTRTEEPRRRIDVVPVVAWDDVEVPEGLERGDRVWVAGAVQRRFWTDRFSGRTSRIEVVAQHIQTNVPADNEFDDDDRAYESKRDEELEGAGLNADTLDAIVKDVIG